MTNHYSNPIPTLNIFSVLTLLLVSSILVVLGPHEGGGSKTTRGDDYTLIETRFCNRENFSKEEKARIFQT